MEEFIDLYRYLARCYVGLEKLERNNVLDSFQGISKLVSHEITGPLLINLLSDIVKRSDEDDGAMNDALRVVLPVILDIEHLVGISDISDVSDVSDNSGKSDVSDISDKKQGNIHLFDKKTVLRSFGACKVYPKIFEYVFTNLKTKFRSEDAAILIKNYYTNILKRGIADSSSRTYANCYMRYMLEENLVTAEFGDYTKKELTIGELEKQKEKVLIEKTKDSKETKELKKFGDRIINGNGKDLPSVEPESKDESKRVPEDESKREDELKEKNEFENFQDRILEAAETKHWNKVKIEEIEEAFKGTKSPKQIEKALARLLVKKKIIQYPPEPKEFIYAKEHDEPKPKGYIIFQSLNQD